MFLLFVSVPIFVMIKMPFAGIKIRLLVLNILERPFDDLIQLPTVQPYPAAFQKIVDFLHPGGRLWRDLRAPRTFHINSHLFCDVDRALSRGTVQDSQSCFTVRLLGKTIIKFRGLIL